LFRRHSHEIITSDIGDGDPCAFDDRTAAANCLIYAYMKMSRLFARDLAFHGIILLQASNSITNLNFIYKLRPAQAKSRLLNCIMAKFDTDGKQLYIDEQKVLHVWEWFS